MTVFMLMMLHQETPVVQFLLQFGPFLAVFVQSSLVDQLLQFASIMLE